MTIADKNHDAVLINRPKDMSPTCGAGFRFFWALMRFIKWFFTYGLPMYAIVGGLLFIALHVLQGKSQGPTPSTAANVVLNEQTYQPQEAPASPVPAAPYTAREAKSVQFLKLPS
jgi:hypothetical protein